MALKKLEKIIAAPPAHWVGDGFPVRSLFSYSTHSETLSPFLLLDFAGPAEFTPAATPRGVGQHPHRGHERFHRYDACVARCRIGGVRDPMDCVDLAARPVAGDEGDRAVAGTKAFRDEIGRAHV